MTELEKLEQELLSRMVDEPEMFAETEDICTIDPKTRTITIPASRRLIGTESDESVERLYFRCPKIVGDNIDLSTLSLRINYQNAGREKDRYIVTDMKVDGESITFSWQIRRKVAKYKGNVSFIICAVKTSDGIIKNEWNTTLNTECEVLEGLEVDQTGIEEETKDVVEQLLELLHASTEEAVGKVTAEGAAQVASVQAEGEKQLDSVREVVQEVAADREQIQENKADIAALYQIKAPAIICEVSGESIVVEDSSGMHLSGLSIYGKSAQVQTKGYQLFDVNRIKDISGGEITIKNNGDGSLEVIGNGVLTDYFSTHYQVSHEQTLRLLKIGRITTSGNNAYPRLHAYLYYNGNKNYYNLVHGDEIAYSDITEEMLAHPDCVLRCYIYGVKGKQIKQGTIKPMLYQDGDGTWEQFTGGKPSPNPDYPQEIEKAGADGDVNIDLHGAQLAPIIQENIIQRDNLIAKINQDGSIEVKWNPKYQYASIFSEEIKLNPGKYYISGGEPVKGKLIFQMIVTDETGGKKYYSNNTVEITGEELSIIINIHYASKTIEPVNYVIEPMLNMGTKPLPIEQYKQQYPITIQTPNSLPGIPVSSDGNYTDETGQQWICDEIDLKRGKYVQRVKSIVFDGSEGGWKLQGINDYGIANFYIYITDLDTTDVNAYLISHFQKQNTLISVEKNEGAYINKQQTLYIRVNKERASTIDEYKNFLNQNNFTYIHILKTPLETDLPPEVIEQFKALHTNHPNTVITNDSGAGMKLSYVADTKSYIDEKFKQLQETVVNTQTQMLKGV